MSRVKKEFTIEQKEWILGNIEKCKSICDATKKYFEKFNEKCDYYRFKNFCEENGIYVEPTKHSYSVEELNWIKENRDNYSSLIEMAKDFNEKFNANLDRHKMNSVLQNYKIKRSDLKHNEYTKEFNDWLINNYNNYINEELVVMIKEKFNIDLSVSGIQSLMNRRGLFKENNGRFKEHELGFEIIRKGIPYIKVKKDPYISDDYFHNYRRKANVIYEQYHNVKLKKDDIVLNLDGNPFNFDKENLILLSRNEFQVYHIKSQYNEISNINIKKLLLNIVKLESIIKNEGKE